MSEITSINRAAAVFNLFIKGDTELGPTEVARKLMMNKTSAIRLMSMQPRLRRPQLSSRYRLQQL